MDLESLKRLIISHLLSCQLIIILAMFGFSAFSQMPNIGHPKIQNYSVASYKAGTQNWEIDFFNENFMCVANNSGLLLFDGHTWELFPTPKRTIVRSIAIDHGKKRIYVGAQGEFGYFDFSENDRRGSFIDLLHGFSDKNLIADIWEMVELDGNIYFRSNNYIFQYKDDELKNFSPGGSITFLQKVNHKIIFNDMAQGLFQLEGDSLIFIRGSERLTQLDIIDLIELNKDHFLVLTSKNGIYIVSESEITTWTTNCDQYLYDNWINAGYYSKNQNILAIGTFSGGIILINEDGKALSLLNIEQGLQSNTITSITEDVGGHFWLSSYYGLDRISSLESEQWIYPGKLGKKTIFDIEFWNGYIFFATSNGLYYKKEKSYYNILEEDEFTLIPETNAECWGLDVIDDQLFLAHNDGAFSIGKNLRLSKLDHEAGAWKFIKINSDKLLIGGYNGVSILKKMNDRWQFSHKIPNLNLSSRILVLNNDNVLWMTHPYVGIFRISSKDQFEHSQVTQVDSTWGISNLNNCYGKVFNNSFLVSNDDGIYAYDDAKEKFLPDENLNALFEGERVLRLFNYGEEDWYISNKSAGKLLVENVGTSSRVTRRAIVANNNYFVGGFENLNVHHTSQMYVCTNQGVRYLSAEYSEPKIFLRINTIRTLVKDSIIYHSMNSDTESIELDHHNNRIRIEFNANFSLFNYSNILYQSRLKGFADQWEDWTSSTSKEYNYLPPGDYTFELRARSESGQISEIKSIDISLRPPFYKTNLALFIYFILSAVVMYLLSTLPSRKHKKQNTILLEQKNQTDIKNRDLELENYNIQLEAKNKELAYTTMHLIQHNKTMQKVKSEILEVKKSLKEYEARQDLNRLLKLLNEHERREDNWEKFSKHFNQVHHGFLTRLKNNYPNLSAKDLKICSYLRLNLSTKEIAPLMGISIRGVEISRYRLRKKLNLEHGIDLNEFMIKF